MSTRVVIVGGGVIGGMCAWYLNQSGLDVTIVDRQTFGQGCSHGNCGYVSPSHVLPLCKPGAVGSTLKAMLGRNSPLSIKPRLSPALWRWMWQFMRHCNKTDMLQSARGIHQLLQSSKRLYQELLESENIECEWQERGILFVFQSPSHFEEYAETNELLEREFGVAAVPYDGRKLVQIEPALRDGLGGAWYYDCDCHLRPDRLMSALRDRLIQQGVRIVEHFPVRSLVRDSRRVRAVAGDQGEIDADQFVIATGAWTPFLNRELGCRIPIEPGKGYSLTMPHPNPCPRIPMILEQHRVAITPMDSAYRIGSTMEFAGFDERIHRRRLNLLKTSAELYLRNAWCEPIEEEWFGWRPMTWDSKPIIDRAPEIDNAWIAAGHNMLGLSTATGTGRLICELMTDQTPHIDPSHYSVARFR